jgi:MFS family permease
MVSCWAAPMSTPSASSSGWLRKGRVLRHRNVRRYFGGYVASTLGTAMASIALVFAVLNNGGTAADLGYVLAAGIIPQVVLMVGGGAIADRLGRRWVMLSADVLRTASQALLAVLLFVGHPPIAVFIVLASAVGVGDAFFAPAFNGLVVEIAPEDEMGDANALFGMAESTTQVVGPALAGVLVAVADPATVLALDAASYALSDLALAGLVLTKSAVASERSIIHDLVEGWGEFRSRTWLWATTLQFATFNLLAWGPFLVLGPVLAKAYLGGARSWGIIMALYGGGSVAGGLIALGRRPRRPLLVATISSLGFAAPLALLAVGLPSAEVAAGALIGGLGAAGFNIFWATSIQQQVPADAQARVFAFGLVGAYSAGPIAFAAAGPVAAAVGPRPVLGVGAAWTVLAGLAVLAMPAIRKVRWTAADQAPASEAAAQPAPEGRPG